MYGGNFGLVGNPKRAKWLLRRFCRITNEKARIIAITREPYATTALEHLEYHKLNRKRGRLPGQVRLRVRYKKYATPWFDWLIVSKKEMADILEGTGWVATKFIDSAAGYLGCYAAVIEKTEGQTR